MEIWGLSLLLLFYVSMLLTLLFIEHIMSYKKSKKKKVKLRTVSVIIPAYNEEKNIAKAIESVLNSNYPKEKLEIIVVDDKSRDRTVEVAKRYEKYGVKVIRRKRRGNAALAKNDGIKKAKGEVIITMDADSVMRKDAILRFMEAFDEGCVGISGAVRVKNKRNIIEKLQWLEYDMILFFRKATELIHSVYVTPGGMSAFLKEKIIEVGLFNPKSITEDQEIAFKLQKKNYKVCSCLKSIAYTLVPSTLKGFILQRVRWIRGGLMNRFLHKELFNIKYGDFVIFGFLLDFLYAIPAFLFLYGQINRFFFNLYWNERIGIINTILLSIDPLSLIGIVSFLSLFPFTWYAINSIRKEVKGKPLELKDLPIVLLYTTLYGMIFIIIWLIVIWKEIKREGYKWGTK